MNEILQSIRDNFTGFDISLIPTDGTARLIMYAIGAAMLFLIIRMMKHKKLRDERLSEEEPLVEQISDRTVGAFGGMTDALAGQLPESRKETKDFKQLLRQAGLYSPTAQASIYAFRFIFLFLPLIFALILSIIDPPNSGQVPADRLFFCGCAIYYSSSLRLLPSW